MDFAFCVKMKRLNIKIVVLLLFFVVKGVAQEILPRKYVFCQVVITRRDSYPIMFCGFCSDTDSICLNVCDANTFIENFWNVAYYFPYTLGLFDMAYQKAFSSYYGISGKEAMELCRNFEENWESKLENLGSKSAFVLKDKSKVELTFMKMFGVFVHERKTNATGWNSNGIRPMDYPNIDMVVYPICILENQQVNLVQNKGEICFQ